MHLRYASRPIRKELNHQLAIELRRRRRKERYGEGRQEKMGWKERLALGAGESVDAGEDGSGSEQGREGRG